MVILLSLPNDTGSRRIFMGEMNMELRESIGLGTCNGSTKKRSSRDR